MKSHVCCTKIILSVIFSEELFKNEPVLIEKITGIIIKRDQYLISLILAGQEKGEIREDIAAENLSIMIMGTLRLFVKKSTFKEYHTDLHNGGKDIIESIKLLIAKK